MELARCGTRALWRYYLILLVVETTTALSYGTHQICTAVHCEYHLTVKWGRTMVYQTMDGIKAYNVVPEDGRLKVVPNSYHQGPDAMLGTYVEAKHVVTGDGYPREVILVNNQFPAPTIQVMNGALVTVHVTNMLLTEGLSIHWHGMRQMNNTWMDGVPFVTQLPIMPRQTFRYRFRALPAGTHWYHSHFKDQRVDGFYGMLIVHQTLPHVSEFHVALSDWYHVNGRTLSAASPFHIDNPGTGEYEMAPNSAHDAQAMLELLQQHHSDEMGEHKGHETVEDVDELQPEPDGEVRNHDGITQSHHEMHVITEITAPTETVHQHDHVSGQRSVRHIGHKHDNHVDITEADNDSMDHDSSSDHHHHQEHTDSHTMGSPYGQRYDDQNIISVLVNGRGRYGGNDLPLTHFRVNKGHVYRFRMANAGAHLPIMFSIDQHVLVVVATDGAAIWPIKAQTVLIFPGETLDIEVTANQSPGKYWVRVEGKHGSHQMNGYAVLSYTHGNMSEQGDPSSSPRDCTVEHKCVYFNCPPVAFPTGTNKSCISMANSRSLYIDAGDDYWMSKEEHVEEIFLNMGLTFAPNFNGKSFKVPVLPFHIKSDESFTACDETACDNGCSCTHIISLPFDKTVDLIITNYDPLDQHVIYGHHPIHLHGHNFAVLKQGFPSVNTSTGELVPNPDILCNTTICNKPKWRHHRPHDYNLNDPPIKDTVIVPSLGYTVIRFHTDNPGHWLLHCHIDFHSTAGMTVLFEEAADVIPKPPNYQTVFLPHPYIFHEKESNTNHNDEDYRFLYTFNSEGTEFLQIKLWSGVGLVLGSFVFGLVIPLLILLCIKCHKKKKPRSITW